MIRRYQPIPRMGAPYSGRALAGSADLWFDQVMWRDRTGASGVTVLDDCPQEVLARLSSPRAAIAGLSLDRPRVMGILNVTPDSFSDGGDLATVSAAVARARAMEGDVDILDIGGESTRPGAQEVDVAEEIRRTAPVIRALRDAGITTPISIDTRKSAVAEAALEAGADIVNDVSAFEFDPELAHLVAERDVPVCLMHAKGLPENMQDDPRYEDVTFEVLDHLEARIALAEAAGIRRDRIITDPGIGFGKTLQHNVILLRALALLHDLGLPILLGVSRKRFIGALGQADEAKDRAPGSIAVALDGVRQGAHILRVHDVRETAQALRLQNVLMTRDAL
ncbi:Dihydropteroate synthase [Aliiroseovarius sp. xm-m-379]|uniref:dihydropteroate synthase n=1 Tax=Aliiroseovarius sp. xm-m-378 TaxID=2651831 RepID=UPI001A0A2C91|nr:Dihydropteroate synthase [Aliiroseovarius sp. xm-d-517]NRP24494.1 Dihydropteroate synthase [Aliiroseovarius sp. xm-m-379]NRP29696.1 Dihydropteroate synthase [Aliiroseovarius sp. xm-m-314]NRP33293.1 Dihydropteroate synthase [Aliiroseovarius sp. xm-a-104]NRP39706.1 Dihydropteroate synthase [Aliiroseovarius sp. xm-m-339-2]NRP43591.1 Dihydropteroate synthase [Aliiroseovarius sp. xm-m-378]NRP49261.1 Dihydropteroate synthase [Aliiroseovarius sp. xm-m-354]NRP60712.1 Dihydropteroate synthase [Ali